MATHIVLMKLTEQGIKDIRNAPPRIDAAAKAIEAMGGKMTGFYVIMGEYDYIAITEGLSNKAGAVFILKLGSQGNVRTTTLKAFTRQEFAERVMQHVAHGGNCTFQMEYNSLYLTAHACKWVVMR
jgi:uncharacterized protein with GYD domain